MARHEDATQERPGLDSVPLIGAGPRSERRRPSFTLGGVAAAARVEAPACPSAPATAPGRPAVGDEPAPMAPPVVRTAGVTGPADPARGPWAAEPGRGVARVPAAELDWALVEVLRGRVAQELSESGMTADREAQEAAGQEIIDRLLRETAAERLQRGAAAPSPGETDSLRVAVFNAVFRMGRLQPLVDNEQVENIEGTGYDNVLLEYADGTLHEAPPIAENDDELVRFFTDIASRSEANPRPFSPASPRLHLRLDGGARLAATAWVTPRPSFVIRRHRMRSVRLEDLEARGTLTPVMTDFLRAAVKARRSIVVAGPQGAGKTTLVRALCSELDPWERIGTFETEFELHLHELTEQHRRIVAWEARPGSGEIGPDGRAAGEVTLDDLLIDSFRFNLSRQIVGEVRGREVLAMIKAMQSGTGSISTTHSDNAAGAIRKLITCAMESGSATEAYATRAVAEHIHLVVQMHLDARPVLSEEGSGSGAVARRRRWVSEIIAVTPGEESRGYAITNLFTRRPDGPGRADVWEDTLQDVVAEGFDLGAFQREAAAGGWSR